MKEDEREATSKVASLLRGVAIPVAIAVFLALLPIANYKLGNGESIVNGPLYLLVRLFVIGSAGFVAVRFAKLHIPYAALAGVVVFFAEQATIAGWFLFDGQLTSAFEVAKTFALFVGGSVIVGAAGGAVAMMMNRWRTRTTP